MTAYASLRASWGSRQGCEMCFECRTGGQGLKTNWLESVQRTAAWFSGKPVSETVPVCRPLGAALCQPSPDSLLFGAAHLSSRDMWCCTGSRCVGRGWILKHPLWSSHLGCRCYLGIQTSSIGSPDMPFSHPCSGGKLLLTLQDPAEESPPL